MKNGTSYNTEKLLEFMIPGLEMGIRTLQDQIKAIQDIIKGNITELPIERAVDLGLCTNCGAHFKGAQGLRVHIRRMHAPKLMRRKA